MISIAATVRVGDDVAPQPTRPEVADGDVRRLKREAGEKPARSRHCDRGADPRSHHWDGCPGKVRASVDPEVRRPAPGRQRPPRAKRPEHASRFARQASCSRAGRLDRPRVRPGRKRPCADSPSHPPVASVHRKLGSSESSRSQRSSSPDAARRQRRRPARRAHLRSRSQ
jgi:hypothetical protein